MSWFRKPKPTRKESEKTPKGTPVPSIAPKVGYGDHSCLDCLNTGCPVAPFIAPWPNQCSSYWPPNMPNWKPGPGYYKTLAQIAKEMAENQRLSKTIESLEKFINTDNPDFRSSLKTGAVIEAVSSSSPAEPPESK